MTQRARITVLGLAVLAMAIVLVLVDRRMQDAGGYGIIEFELAGSVSKAQEILSAWGDEGRDAARLSLWLDLPYLVLYATFGWLLAQALSARAAGIAIVVAAVCDAIEDVLLLIVLDGPGDGSPAPFLAAVFAVVKFAGVAVAIVIALAAAVRRRRAR